MEISPLQVELYWRPKAAAKVYHIRGLVHEKITPDAIVIVVGDEQVIGGNSLHATWYDCSSDIQIKII